jgi:hypothetical protein
MEIRHSARNLNNLGQTEGQKPCPPAIIIGDQMQLEFGLTVLIANDPSKLDKKVTASHVAFRRWCVVIISESYLLERR